MPSLSTDVGSFDLGMRIFQVIYHGNVSPARFLLLIIIALSAIFARSFGAFRAEPL